MSEQHREHPAWLKTTGIISAALPEPPLAHKYRGAQHSDVEEQYERALSDEALDSLAQAGVTLLWARFYSGFGLEFERAEQERTKDLIERAHARGLKVAATVQLGLVVAETLWLEENECHNWLQVNVEGQHPLVPHAGGSFAVRPCYNAEGFLRYMERVCAAASDCRADLIHFDHAGYNPEPDTCRCPVCVAVFRDFLRHQYGPQDEKTRQAGLARFGHSTFTHVRPPSPAPLTPSRSGEGGHEAVVNPHEQEWTRFKVQTLTACLGRLAQAVRRRNPECAVGADLLRETTQGNEAAACGMLYAEQLPHVDVVTAPPAPAAAKGSTEKAPEAMWHGTKAAQALGVAAEHGLRNGDLELNLALNLTFNRYGLGVVGLSTSAWLTPGWQDRAAQNEQLRLLRRYVAFYAQHRELLVGGRNVPAVGLYQDTASLMFDGGASRAAQRRLQQLTEGGRYAYEPLYPQQLAGAAAYGCVVVPDCGWLSNPAVAALRRYVEGGGNLLVFGDPASRDEWGRWRTLPALAELLPGDASQPVRQVGEGRVAYVPSPGPHEPPPTEYLGALKELAWERERWRVEASGPVLSQLVETANGALALHVVNALDTPATSLQCMVRSEKQPVSVQPLAPGQELAPVAFEWREGAVHFAWPELRPYVAFVVSF
jgi:hypothetical protein